MLNYLDDWLICSPSRRHAVSDTAAVVAHLQQLGLSLNVEKSQLNPSQQIIFLGVSLDSVTMLAGLSDQRIVNLYQCLSHFSGQSSVRSHDCQRLLGLMAAASQVVRLGLLHMRPIQRWYLSRALHPVKDRNKSLLITSRCLRARHWWNTPQNLSRGVQLGRVCRREVLTTDASLSGWGAVLNGVGAQGVWYPPWDSAHINVLELRTIYLSLCHFLPALKNKHVLVRTDNMSAIAYINHQGGLRSSALHSVAQTLLLWADKHLSSIRAVHLPGSLNSAADLLSRGRPHPSEWRLHPAAVHLIWARFGKARVDLFASKESAHCPLWFSLCGNKAPLGVDALAHVWPQGLLYAFPPTSLIPAVLEKTRRENLEVLLVAPRRHQAPWFAEIHNLLSGEPWEIPLRKDLLSQAGGSCGIQTPLCSIFGSGH